MVIGSGTRVGCEGQSTTIITNTVIGRNCTIGAGVRLDGAHIFDNVVIEDHCTVIQVCTCAVLPVCMRACVRACICACVYRCV